MIRQRLGGSSVVCWLAIATAAVPAAASELYVRAGAEAGNGEQRSPYGTIGAALAAAQEGDTIRIAQGTYPEQIVVQKSRVKLKGGYDSNFERGRSPEKYETIVDGQNKFRPFQIGVDGAAVTKFLIDGLIITRGLADGAEGSDGKGGGILIVNGASGKITRCQLVDNRATDDGGAIENNGNGTLIVDRCLFRGNSARDDGGAIRLQGSQSNTTISNCVFVENAGLDKYVIQAKGDTKILNCTFVGNTSDSRGVIASRSKLSSTDAKVTIANCIFAANKSLDDDPLLFADDESVPIAATNCLFFNNETTGGLGESVRIGSNGHKEGDPLFVNAVAGDFRLSEGSPAIDGAAALDAIKKDFEGNPRSQGAGADIGAFESAPSPKVSEAR
jgi:predicted outer membrane repeat protein